jgi:hypothetical protein
VTATGLTRYLDKARRLGPLGTARRAWERGSDRLGLEARALAWTLREARLPSDRAVLAAAGGNWASMGQFVEHLCRKEAPAFFFSPTERDEYVRCLRERLAREADRTLQTADEVCRHRFYLLGREVQFGERVNWHLDPDTGQDWPRDYFERMDERLWSQRVSQDSKLVWELNRHQHLVTLGKAYWLTRDERYTREAADQLLTWIEDNPPGMGINWYSALEVGLRLISWCLAFHFLRADPGFVRTAAPSFVKSLYQQTRFLRRHLTADWPVPNNHLIGECAGLIAAGALFPEFGEADDWLSTGLRLMESAVEAQVASDGASREQTTGYQRFVMELLTLPVLLGQRGAIPDSPTLVQALERMLDYVLYVTAPDGAAPRLGDGDDGRGHALGSGLGQAGFSELLCLGALLFRRSDLKLAAGAFAESALWLLGPEAAQKYDELEATPPARASAAFPDGGHYVLRSDWTPQADLAFTRCGSFGLGGEGFCAHSHCDLLGLELWLRGRQLLADPGTYTYRGPRRDWFRSTEAHNTLMVDGVEQARPQGEFAWSQVHDATCLDWDAQARAVTGQLEAAPGVWQERQVRLDGPGRCRVADSVRGDGQHRLVWRYHLAPGLEAELDGSTLRVRGGEDSMAVVVAPPPVRLALEQHWHSPAYGELEPATTIVGEWEGELTRLGLTFEWLFAALGESDGE